MKYRVVQLVDGRYQCQFRVFGLWKDSTHAPSTNKEEQISFAKDGENPPKPPLPVAEVWPRQRRLTP